VIVRAANVLGQYPEESVRASWSAMQAQLSSNGVIVEGWPVLSTPQPHRLGALTVAWQAARAD